MNKKMVTILAVTTGTAMLAAGAYADNRKGKKHDRRASMIERADANKDGKLSLEEMVESASTRFAKVDKNNDGEISVEELADRLERRRTERRAKRMLARMDYNGDGKVTKDEIENRTKKRFALMDANDDGIVEKSEMKNKRFGRHGGKRRHHRGNQDL